MIPTVILTRAMDFKTIAKINNSASFGAGVLSIVAASLGAGVWALAINAVLTVVFAMPFLYLSTKWKPRRNWNRRHFKNIFGFGAYSTSTVVFSTITYNVDNLMIGKLLGASLLGSYTLAFSLTENLRQMTSGILNQVMYPVFGKNQDDKEKLRAYFLKIINFNALLIYPIMTFFLLFAEEIVLGFFGDKWMATIIPLQLLSVAMMLHLLVNSFTSLIRGLGKPKLEMKVIIGLTVLVLIPGLWLGISYYGLTGAASAILLNKLCLVVIGIAILKKQIDLKISQVLTAVKSALIGISLAGSSILLLKLHEPFETIYLLGPVFIAFYLLVVYRLEKSSVGKIIKDIL
jgi:O-antigen/teichoic acid export membrane protein